MKNKVSSCELKMPDKLEIKISWDGKTEKCAVKVNPKSTNGLFMFYILKEVTAEYAKRLKLEKIKIENEKRKVTYIG